MLDDYYNYDKWEKISHYGEEYAEEDEDLLYDEYMDEQMMYEEEMNNE